MLAPSCDYCGATALLVKGSVLYPKWAAYKDLNYWCCPRCDAYVGCHKLGAYIIDRDGNKITSDGSLPLGGLADAPLRAARSRAHLLFDTRWRKSENPKESRKESYRWLAKEMGMFYKDCHIGRFDLDRCNQVISICQKEIHRIL